MRGEHHAGLAGPTSRAGGPSLLALIAACGPLDTAEIQTVLGGGSMDRATAPVPGGAADLTGALRIAASGATLFVTTRSGATWAYDSLRDRARVVDLAEGVVDLDFRSHGALRGVRTSPCELVPQGTLLAPDHPACPPGLAVERIVAPGLDALVFLQLSPLPVAFVLPDELEASWRPLPEPCGPGEPVGDLGVLGDRAVVSCPRLGTLRPAASATVADALTGLDRPGPLGPGPEGGIAWIEVGNVLAWREPSGAIRRVGLGEIEAMDVAWADTGPFVLDARGPWLVRARLP